MKVLLIGGSGNISWHCTNRLLEMGHEVYVLNRRCTLLTRRALNQHAQIIEADIKDEERVKKCIGDMYFDVIADFICYTREDALRNIRIFKNKSKQYIFISSTGGYVRNGYYTPINENRKMESVTWQYSKNKIEAEKVFWKEYEQERFPITIVRPGHTYDTLLPEAVGNGDWTIAKRILDDKPIVVHGDGTTWWTLTHSLDFANAFVGLVGNEDAIGEAFNIVGDDVMNWNDITQMVAKALGKNNPSVVYVPTSIIEQFDMEFASGIKEHKMWNDIYDNSKIKQYVPKWSTTISYKMGINETVNWLLADRNRQRVNNDLDKLVDKLCKIY